MNPKRMLESLLPWVLFSVIVERKGASAAGVAGLASAALSFFFLLRHRAAGLKLLDLTGVTTFAVLTVLAFASSGGFRTDVVDYGRGVSGLVLAFVMIGSVPVLPFTEQYARDVVPAQYWSSPAFRAGNRQLSATWGAVVLLGSCSRLYAGHLEHSHLSTVMDLLLNWVVPAVLLLVAGLATKRASAPAAVAA